VQLFRVVHTTELYGRFTTREYLAELEDAWYLWWWIDRTASLEAEGQLKWLTKLGACGGVCGVEGVVAGETNRALVKTTVQVFGIHGHEVCPEKGFSGMNEFKKKVPEDAAGGVCGVGETGLPEKQPTSGEAK
jgi:hypothetical protein